MDFPTFAMNMTIRSSGLMLDPPSSNLREELFASIVEQLWDAKLRMDFMRKAIDEACQGVDNGDGGPFGAVIVRNNSIIATGHNMVLKTNDPTAHAEITAIRNACSALGTFDLSGCQLYTSCYPCPMCMGAALWSRVNAIYYATTPEDAEAVGFDDKAFYEFLKNPVSDGVRKVEQIPVDNQMEPFNKWQQLESKIQY
uniref:CMP/dCMP-type deaminase domain-containing protein n=1 Tax=Ascaris lumbricoides TaxID=6252 RepID=A0A0M3I4V4_ASCLU